MLTPGEILKNKRKELGKTIFEVSQETRILEKYIKQIEANQFELFDSPVFARGFIKIYSKYLNLDEEKVLALFRRISSEGKETSFKKKNIFNFNSLLSTRNVLSAISIIFFMIFSLFIYLQLYNFQQTPFLEVYSPVDGYLSDKPELNVEGKTSNKAILTINNEVVKVENESFKYQILLTEGENTINVTSTNTKNKEKYAQRIIKVTYTRPKPIEEVKTEKQEKLTLDLKIKGEPTWVKLIIDDKQKIAQILNGNFKSKYSFLSGFEIVTGRPDMTEVLVNKERIELTTDKESGVAKALCRIEDSRLSCEE